MVRDPLANSTGLQGIIEVGIIISACLLMLVENRGTRTHLKPHLPLILMLLYGLLAVGSSVSSFNPTLSLAKAFVFFVVLLISYAVANHSCAPKFIQGVYAGHIIAIVAGISLSLVAPLSHPLLVIDDYTGRTRLALFETPPNLVGETSGMLFLLAYIFPVRTRWYWQLLLFAVNILAGEKTATIALIVSAAMICLAKNGRGTRNSLIIASSTTAGCLAILVSLWERAWHYSFLAWMIRLMHSVYGDDVHDTLSTIDGRMDIWKEAVSLDRNHILLGFGFSGARDRLMDSVSWSGHAHNGILEASLSAGVFGASLLILAWCCSFIESFSDSPHLKTPLICLHVYILTISLIGPTFDEPSYFVPFIFVLLPYWLNEQLQSGRRLALNNRPALLAAAKGAY